MRGPFGASKIIKRTHRGGGSLAAARYVIKRAALLNGYRIQRVREQSADAGINHKSLAQQQNFNDVALFIITGCALSLSLASFFSLGTIFPLGCVWKSSRRALTAVHVIPVASPKRTKPLEWNTKFFESAQRIQP
jgi:hypothetical protein